MAWRLHLSNRTIQQLDILPGKLALLAAWWRRDRVTYYDLHSGALIQESLIEQPEVDDRNSLTWQEFVRNLNAPNGSYLPQVYGAYEVIYRTDQEHIRLYRAGAADLFLQLHHGSDEIKLDVRSGITFQQVMIDRSGQMIATLDQKGRLHLYRQTKRIGMFDLDLGVRDTPRPQLGIARGGEHIYLADVHQIMLVDAAGKVVRRVQTHYALARMVCSPNARWLATSDLETGVLRVYDGETLHQTHQRFAIDLLASATQTQLLADLPPVFLALNALTIDDNGVLAFAMSGMICVTDISRMDDMRVVTSTGEVPAVRVETHPTETGSAPAVPAELSAAAVPALEPAVPVEIPPLVPGALATETSITRAIDYLEVQRQTEEMQTVQTPVTPPSAEADSNSDQRL